MAKISVIMTTYQAEDSVERAILSVNNTIYRDDIELIIVDDCSKDNTKYIVEELQKEYRNIKFYILDKNSGSPSAPRNLGIEKATGKYITFLDDDDEILADHLLEMVEEVDRQAADFAKGYLLVSDGIKVSTANQIDASKITDNKALIETIFRVMSMNSDFIIRRELLISRNIRYRTDLKIGEDTLFAAEVLSGYPKTIYLDNYFLIHYSVPLQVQNLASTQNWSDKELRNQIRAWKSAYDTLIKSNIDYYELRLAAALRNVMLSIVRYSNGISADTFNSFHEFVKQTEKYTKNRMNLGSRYKQLYDAILSGSYSEYQKESKRRLLINGYDLKFILPVIPYLEHEYEIKIDEWTGHNSHDEKQSKSMLEWADIIWCEWMLGNAVYYSKMKNKNQRLVIRAHRFELGREFGNQIDYEKVNLVFAVGYYYLERFAEKFSIPAKKMRLLSNYIESTIYSKEKSDEAAYHIGLVGILPSRKGLKKGLTLLQELRKADKRFKLCIMGQAPSDVTWIQNNPKERQYFDECDEFIKEHDLSGHIVYGGYVERSLLYKNIGYVLSLSDKEEPESFHLSPAEGACSGSMGLLLNWPGVEYIYPEEVIYESLDEMKEEIIKASKDREYFSGKAKALEDYMIKNYEVNLFLNKLKQYLKFIMIVN